MGAGFFLRLWGTRWKVGRQPKQSGVYVRVVPQAAKDCGLKDKLTAMLISSLARQHSGAGPASLLSLRPGYDSQQHQSPAYQSGGLCLHACPSPLLSVPPVIGSVLTSGSLDISGTRSSIAVQHHPTPFGEGGGVASGTAPLLRNPSASDSSMSSKARNSVAPLQLGELENNRENNAGLTRSTRRGRLHGRPMYSHGGNRSVLLPCHLLACTSKTCSPTWPGVGGTVACRTGNHETSG